jgi:hypothetical protein
MPPFRAWVRQVHIHRVERFDERRAIRRPGLHDRHQFEDVEEGVDLERPNAPPASRRSPRASVEVMAVRRVMAGRSA